MSIHPEAFRREAAGGLMERRNPRRHCVLEHARTRCVFHWRGVEFLRNETWRASSPIMLLPRSARGTSRPVNGRPDEASKQPRLSSRQVSNLVQATGHAPGSSLCTFGQVGEQPGGQSQSSRQAGKQAGKQASRQAGGQTGNCTQDAQSTDASSAAVIYLVSGMAFYLYGGYHDWCFECHD